MYVYYTYIIYIFFHENIFGYLKICVYRVHKMKFICDIQHVVYFHICIQKLKLKVKTPDFRAMYQIIKSS